jgi:magnesium transporter
VTAGPQASGTADATAGPPGRAPEARVPFRAVAFDRRGLPHPVGDDASLRSELRRARRRGGFVWLESTAPDAAEMSRLAALLGLDPRSAAEAAKGRQQPKIQQFDRHLTVVLWTLEFRRAQPRIVVGEVFLFVQRTSLLVVRREGMPDARPPRSPLDDPDVTVSGGALGAAFRIIDDQCDEYAELAGGVEDELEDIEQEVYDDSVVESRRRIYRLRQEIGKIGRAVGTLATALEASQQHLSTVSVGGRGVEPYVRDVLDRLGGTNAVLRDQSSTLDAVVASHENNVSNRQNDDTRRISAIAALISVPALTSGIFGMNFVDLPLVKVPFAWAWVLGAALLIDTVMVWIFRRRHWL